MNEHKKHGTEELILPIWIRFRNNMGAKNFKEVKFSEGYTAVRRNIGVPRPVPTSVGADPYPDPATRGVGQCCR